MSFSINASGQERIELADGSTLNVFMVLPKDQFTEVSPLVILMGGGPGNASISKDTSQWLGSGFASRGWTVAVPISPSNRSFRGAQGNAKVEQLIVMLQRRPGIKQGKVLLAGVSNGGMSALEIAQRNPSRYLGVAAVPALFSVNDSDKKKVFEGFPVYLRIGSQDQLGWADRFDATVASLTEAGARLDAEVLDGAPHMFRMDWSTLGPWLEDL
ncbi:MAG: putative esterase [Pseudohongiellaceae bacterium]|jgi:predicted esterase